MAGNGSTSTGDGSLADTVIASNRGPLAFRLVDGRPVKGAAAGGLASSLLPLVRGTAATWVACALNDADRMAAADGLVVEDGLRVELLDPDPNTYRMAYDVVSNATLWFCHHQLFDGPRRPRSDRHGVEAWEAYRSYNQTFTDRIAEVAPEGGRVLVQDYHLTLVGAQLAAVRPDLRSVHFTHTPFADPSNLRMLPTWMADEMLEGMAGFRSCGFHTERWAAAYRSCQRQLGPERLRGDDSVSTFASAITVDPADLAASAAKPAVAAARMRLEEAVGGTDRQVIVRVDRMELSKNLLRGFWAYEELLEREPHRHGRVVFLALAYPSRQGLAEYLAYQNEVESTVTRINERFGAADWSPIVLLVEDDYPRSLAALSLYDVLLVNPVRDGLNLVAKEGPLVNTADGVLVLSREAGAFDELWPGAVEVNPFDVSGTATALAEALDMEPGQRAAMAKSLRELILSRPTIDWLNDQLTAAG